MASAVTKSISLDHKACSEYKQASTVKERRNKEVWKRKKYMAYNKTRNGRINQETDWRKRREEKMKILADMLVGEELEKKRDS